MSQSEQSTQTEDPDLGSHRMGVMFYVVLYGGIAGVVGIGFWVTMYFL